MVKNKWISVKDQLPSDGQRVLFYSTENNQIHSGCYLESDFYDWSHFIWDTTYWMSTPIEPEEYNE